MSLRDEQRAQSIQIGAVLLFAVLIILFALYQAVLVPAQNREVEFNHNQRVEGDMVEVRNQILSTASEGADGYASVELGTDYPARLVGLNPSPPTGTLSTTEQRPVEILAGGTDVTDSVCPGEHVQSRMLEYSPTYSVYSGAGTIRYENSLLYHDFGDGSFLMTEQQLVQNDTVQLVPINRTYNEGGSQTVAVEPKPGRLRSDRLTDPNVTVPTRLSATQWTTALEGAVDETNVVVSQGNLTLDLEGEYRIECTPVGLGRAPASGSPIEDGDQPSPARPADVALVQESWNGDVVTLTFNNTAGVNNLTAARFTHYDDQSAGGPGGGPGGGTGGGPGGDTPPTVADISWSGTPVAPTMDVPGDFRDFTQPVTLAGGGQTTDLTVDFDEAPPEEDSFVLTLELETGETRQYVVPVE